MKIHHTCLNVSNLDRSIDFYKHLGLKLTNRRYGVTDPKREYASMKDEAGNVVDLSCFSGKTIRRRSTPDAPEVDGFDHIGFEVSDVDAAIETLRRSGVTISIEPRTLQRLSVKCAFIEDPDRNSIELMQRL